jgi:uncharacterized membrane protein HdeD (DUF308 family)
MSLLSPFNDQHLPSFTKNWTLFLIWGIALLVLGFFAISASVLTTMVSIVVLGFIILISGAILAIDALSFWWGKWSGFFLHLIIAILYIAVGVTLIKNPIAGSISLTLLLGIFYIIAGIVRLSYSPSFRMPNWGWGWFNGLISLLLGILILTSWPASSLFIIGLFIGIDLVFSGWTYIMSALVARNLTHKSN